jgi:membrane fusion protein, multidrug efflux system
MHRRVVAALAIAQFAPWSCGREPPPVEPAPERVAIDPSHVARVAREPVIIGPRVSGSLEPEQRAVLRAEVAGAVVEVDAELGETVRAGQLLARMEARSLAREVSSMRAALSSAEKALAVAERELARTRRLVAAGALAGARIDSDESAVAAARARVAEQRARLVAATEQLESARVQAPFAGVISRQAVHAGDVVTVGAELFTVIDPSSMRLEGSVPSEHIQALELGTPVRFEVRGYPGRQFEGRVTRIAPAVDPATRQISVVATIPNPAQELVAGLFAEGQVVAERREALTVPANAVERDALGESVLRVENGYVRQVRVETGLSDALSERVEIRSGLSQGDRVIVGPERAVPAGVRVRIVDAGGERDH